MSSRISSEPFGGASDLTAPRCLFKLEGSWDHRGQGPHGGTVGVRRGLRFASGRRSGRLTSLPARYALNLRTRYCVIHRVIDPVPAHPKGFGHFLPTHPSGPLRQGPSVLQGRWALPSGSRHSFNLHAATRTLHATHAVRKEHQDPPQRDEFEMPRLRRPIVDGGKLVTARADHKTMGPRPHFHIQGDENDRRLYQKTGLLC